MLARLLPVGGGANCVLVNEPRSHNVAPIGLSMTVLAEDATPLAAPWCDHLPRSMHLGVADKVVRILPGQPHCGNHKCVASPPATSISCPEVPIRTMSHKSWFCDARAHVCVPRGKCIRTCPPGSIPEPLAHQIRSACHLWPTYPSRRVPVVPVEPELAPRAYPLVFCLQRRPSRTRPCTDILSNDWSSLSAWA